MILIQVSRAARPSFSTLYQLPDDSRIDETRRVTDISELARGNLAKDATSDLEISKHVF